MPVIALRLETLHFGVGRSEPVEANWGDVRRGPPARRREGGLVVAGEVERTEFASPQAVWRTTLVESVVRIPVRRDRVEAVLGAL